MYGFILYAIPIAMIVVTIATGIICAKYYVDEVIHGEKR